MGGTRHWLPAIVAAWVALMAPSAHAANVYYSVDEVGDIRSYSNLANFAANIGLGNGAIAAYGQDAGFMYDGRVIRIEDLNGDVSTFATVDDFVDQTNETSVGSAQFLLLQSGFLFSGVNYVRVSPFGDVAIHPTLADMISDSNGSLVGQVPAYVTDAGYMYDGSKYIRVDVAGNIYSYASLLDFGNDTNPTLEGTVPAYGNNAGFFVAPPVEVPSMGYAGLGLLVGCMVMGALAAMRVQPNLAGVRSR